MMTTDIANWAIESLVATAALIIGVLVLRKPVAKYFGPGWAYALWAIPAARVILPPFTIAAQPEPTPLLTPVVQVSASDFTLPLAMATEQAFLSSADILLIALFWFAGAIVFFLWNLGVHHNFTARVIKTSMPADMALSAQIKQLSKSPIRLIETHLVQGPISFGLRTPTIALPLDFTSRYTEREQLFALRHEIAHIEGRDLWLNMVALLIRALHWPNPLMHWAVKAFKADQEMACDHRVIKHENGTARKIYGQALLKTIQNHTTTAVCPLNSTYHLKERLIMLKSRFSKPGQTILAGLTMAVLSITSLGLSATYVAAQDEKSDKKVVKKRVEIITGEEKEIIFVGDGKHSKVMQFGDGKKVKIIHAGEGAHITSMDGCDGGEMIVEEKSESETKDGMKKEEHVVFCVKSVGDVSIDDPDVLRRTIAALKDEDKRSAEARKKAIEKLEKRLKEIEKK